MEEIDKKSKVSLNSREGGIGRVLAEGNLASVRALPTYLMWAKIVPAKL